MRWQMRLYRFKRFFKERWGLIVATVIATLLATVIIASIKWFIGFAWLKAVANAIEIFSLKKAPITYWCLSLIFVAGFILCLAILYLPKIIRQNLKDYIKDEVEGLIWAWEWSGLRDIVDVKSLCPNCQGQLQYHEEYRDKGYYVCVCCRKFKKEIESRQYKFECEVHIEIKRRIQTGEWKLAKKRMKRLKK